MSVSVPLSDVPQTLLDEVRERLWTYTASVFAVEGTRPRYRGTATCVSALGRPYLLTAAHVWDALAGPRFALSLEADRVLVSIERNHVEPKAFRPTGPEELGPDLALIGIHDLVAADIRQVKAFYNLDKRRPRITESVPYDTGLWAIVGAPAEQSTFGEDEAVMKISLFASRIVGFSQRGDFDFVDLAFYHEGRPDLPQSYGGLSGSGLWQVPIEKSASTGRLSMAEQVHLEGVAFYQEFATQHEGVIRCHGRRSVYEHLFSHVA